MARSLVRHTLAALGAVVLAACGKDPVGASFHVDITADKQAYQPGSMAIVTVRNVGAEPVLYNLCPPVLQRSSNAGWVDEYEPLVSCSESMQTLGPGESTSTSVEIPSGARAGTYRVYFRNIKNPQVDEVSADLKTRKSSKPFEITG